VARGEPQVAKNAGVGAWIGWGVAVVGWRTAMESALYGPGGFYVGTAGPAAHFRTSVHASPLFATALVRLLERVDAALGHPDLFDLVDVGAGRAELLTTIRSELATGAAAGLADRIRYTAVELAPRPDGLDDGVTWRPDLPQAVVGLLVATELLDNVPLDVAQLNDGQLRQVLVDPATGAEKLGREPAAEDAHWLARWWPGDIGNVALGARHRAGAAGTPRGEEQRPAATAQGAADKAGAGFPHRQPQPPAATAQETADNAGAGSAAGQGADDGTPDGRHRSWAGGVSGERAEIGWPRDRVWADAVSRIRRGAALAVDYGHLRDERPPFGTLTGFVGGRQVPPVPDGSRDITAHVAMDAVAAAAGAPYRLVRQRTALRALGIDASRPPLDRADRDPMGYLRALSAAGAAAELIDPAGLGGHWWLLHGVGIDPRGIIEP
jgi:SAM-dependent MidA family methyltransferase